MNIRLVCSALAIGALTAVAVPLNLSVAQPSIEQKAAAPKSAAPNTNMNPQKHRHWRHQGGRHPHFGSRRLRTQSPKATASSPAK